MSGQDILKFYKTYLRPDGLMEAFILAILVFSFVGIFVFLAYIYITAH